MKMRKKILAAALSAAMVWNILPAGPALAAGGETENSREIREESALITSYDMTIEGNRLIDQTGQHDGVLVNMDASDLQEGKLRFTGDQSQYVELPEGAFGEDESFTIAIRFQTSQKAYAWVYCLGAKDTGDYVFLNPMRAGGNTVFTLKESPNGEKSVNQGSVMTPGEEVLATMVFQEDKSAQFYLDGQLIGSVEHGYSVQNILNHGKVGSCVGYLGKSLYAADPGYIGTISSFRVYDEALSAQQVWLNYADEMGFSDEEKAQMDLEAIELEEGIIHEDLSLPQTGKNGGVITWSSDHPDVISSTGQIHRPESTQEVTLTASVTYAAATKSRTFVFQVLSGAEIVSVAKEKLTIANADPVVGNLTLPTELDGADITWESSDPQIITDQAEGNEDYAETPAGVVTRGDQDQKVTLSAVITCGTAREVKTFSLTVKKKAQEKEYAAYLYIHFNEIVVGTSLQQIYFGVSKDGLQWTALNDNQPILESTVGDKGVRDPYIVRSPEGDKFYLIGTDLDIHHQKYGGNWGLMSSQGSQSLVVWESADLVNWTESRLVDVGSSINAGCTWAPEAIYDETTGEYLVFWSSPLNGIQDSTGRKYIFVSKTRDFVSFTEPELYSDPSIDTIDADLYQQGDTYYRLLKQSAQGYVYLQSAKKLLDYTDPVVSTIGNREFINRGMEFSKIENTASGCLETFRGSYEGPTMFKFNDRDEWCVLVDEYGFSSARGYIPFLTENLDEPNSIKLAEDNTYTMTDGAKHGTVIPITQEEYDALVEKWGVTNKKYAKEEQGPILEYDFEEETTGVIEDKAGDNDGQLFGNATYRYDEEKESNVLYLDGTDGAYAQLPTGLFDGLDNMTVVMDIKPETTENYHFDFTVGQDSSKYLFLRIRDNEIRGSITARGNGQEKSAVYTASGLRNRWMQVALVMENHKMTLYLDGQSVAEKKGVGVRSISELGEGLISYLGKSFYDDPYFKGAFDNVKVYNRALNQEEIQGKEPQKHTYVIRYQAGEGGSIHGLTEQEVEEGENAQTVVAVAQEGYEFVQWDDGKTTPERREERVQANQTYTAQFRKVYSEEPEKPEPEKPDSQKPGNQEPGKPQPEAPSQKQQADSVKLSPKKLVLGVKEKAALKVSVLPKTADQKVTFSSSKKSVATVSGKGKVTAKKPGTAIITAVTANGKKAVCRVTVKKAPKRIILKTSTKVLKKGKSYQIRKRLPDNTASNRITYRSSRKAVAAVNDKGKVTAKKKGTAIITVKTFNGKKAKLKIIVK